MVAPEVEAEVRAIRSLLERELDRQATPYFGCWPLLVGVAGLVLGVVLLIESF